MASYFLFVKDTSTVVESVGSVRVNAMLYSYPTESSLDLRIVMQCTTQNC
jgi:hypothetical protein